MALSAEEKSALIQFKTDLKKVLGDRFIELRLFGSKARGDDRPDSDIDVLVIVAPDDWHICDTVYDIATDVLLEADICISPKVISKGLLAQLQRENASFARNVNKDAITI